MAVLIRAGLAVLLAAALSPWIAGRARVPRILVLVAAGALLGPHGLGALPLLPTGGAGPDLLLLGATWLLHEGGLALTAPTLRRIARATTYLATLGVALTLLAMAVLAHALLGWPWRQSLILGAVLAPTDPAAIIPVLRAVPLPERLARVAEAEAAANDAMGAVAVLALVTPGVLSVPHLLAKFLSLTVLGVGAGLLVGALAATASRRLPATVHSDLFFLATPLAAYVVASSVGGSGLLASFACGFAEANLLAVPPRVQPLGLQLVEAIIFLVLGTGVSLPELAHRVAPHLLLVLGLIFLARPLTVVTCLSLARAEGWTGREMVLLSWVRETGVMSAVLVSLLRAEHVPGTPGLFAVVLLAMLLTLVGQASTTRALASRLGLDQEASPHRPGANGA